MLLFNNKPLFRPWLLMGLAKTIDGALRSVLRSVYSNASAALSFVWRAKFIPNDVKLLANLDSQNGELSLSDSKGAITEVK